MPKVKFPSIGFDFTFMLEKNWWTAFMIFKRFEWFFKLILENHFHPIWTLFHGHLRLKFMVILSSIMATMFLGTWCMISHETSSSMSGFFFLVNLTLFFFHGWVLICPPIPLLSLISYSFEGWERLNVLWIGPWLFLLAYITHFSNL